MNILDIRFYLANETELQVAVIGVLLAILALPLWRKNISRSIIRIICFASVLIIAVLVVNRVDMNTSCVDVPPIEGLGTGDAKLALILSGIEADDIRTVGSASVPISDNNTKVEHQNLKGPQRKINGKINIQLICVPYDMTLETENDPTEDKTEASAPPYMNSTGDLSLIIDDYQPFYDGFYHQIPESESSYSFVEFDQGISGHFSYSRELTDIEYEDWGHGGKILDANGNELDIDASFYATTDGVFAVELPEGMPSGTYTYLLYLFVHDEYCEARIPFTW